LKHIGSLTGISALSDWEGLIRLVGRFEGCSSFTVAARLQLVAQTAGMAGCAWTGAFSGHHADVTAASGWSAVAAVCG
jgi:hypothetical protein